MGTSTLLASNVIVAARALWLFERSRLHQQVAHRMRDSPQHEEGKRKHAGYPAYG
jgi:hypothetical protein